MGVGLKRERESVVEEGLVLCCEKALGIAERGGRVGQEGGGESFSAAVELVGGDDFREETEGEGLGGGEEAGGEEELAGALVADLEGEVGGDERGYKADAGLGVAEAGVG